MNAPNPSLFSSAVAYRAALIQAGWTRIGGGAGGEVFHRETDSEVIKVTDGDQCYLIFADFVVQNRSPCLPVLKVVYRDGQWAVTHIELLTPLSDALAADVQRWWDLYVAARKEGQASPPPTNWSAFADALNNLAITGKCGFDMKGENAMQRNGTVVFIDPLS